MWLLQRVECFRKHRNTHCGFSSDSESAIVFSDWRMMMMNAPQGGGDRTVCISDLYILWKLDLLGFMSLINILLYIHRYVDVMYINISCIFFIAILRITKHVLENMSLKWTRKWYALLWLERKSNRKWRLKKSHPQNIAQLSHLFICILSNC